MNEKKTRPDIGCLFVAYLEVILSLYNLSASFILAVRYHRVYFAAIPVAFWGLGCAAGHFIVHMRGIPINGEEDSFPIGCFFRLSFAFVVLIITAIVRTTVSFNDRSHEIVATLVTVFMSIDIVIHFAHVSIYDCDKNEPIDIVTDDSGNVIPELTRASSSSGAIMSQINDFHEGDEVDEELAPPLYASSPPSYVSSPFPYKEPAPPFSAHTHSRV